MDIERHLDAIVRTGTLIFTNSFFAYTSGKIGPYFVQSANIERNGTAYRNAIDSIVELISKTTDISSIDVISGGESRDWGFSNPVAVALEKSHAKLYNNGRILGADVGRKNVVLVSDLNNTGYSVSNKWVPRIRQFGGDINQVFFYIDRMDRGAEKIKEISVEPHAVVHLDENAWEILRRYKAIKETQYQKVMAWKEDKEGWAEGMLKSDKGIARLQELLNNSITRKKAENVLNLGYPHLKYELMKRIGTK